MPAIQPHNLYDLSFLSCLQTSPDGQYASFLRAKADAVQDTYHRELWILDLMQLTCFPLDLAEKQSFLRWHRGDILLKEMRGQVSAVLRRQIAKKGATGDVFLFPGEISAVYPMTHDIYAVISPVLEEPQPEQYTVCEELPLWVDGKGEHSRVRDSIFLICKGQPRRLSPHYCTVNSVAVSPDGRYLAYVGTDYRDVKPLGGGLYLYDAEENNVHTILPQKETQVISSLQFLSSQRLFYTCENFRFFGNSPHFFFYETTSHEVIPLPFYDTTIGNAILSDTLLGPMNTVTSANGLLYYLCPYGSTSRIMCLNELGIQSAVFHRRGGICSIQATPRGILLIGFRDGLPQELYLLDQGKERQITFFHKRFLQLFQFSIPVSLSWNNREGMKFTGWYILPPGFDSQQQYPAILAMHGGPLGIWNESFFHELHCLAGAGFIVFYTNPRGSSGRGEAFSKLTGRAGTIDYQDFMDFTNTILRLCPFIDPERLGLSGGSYAGMMCNWIIGHTQRFSAAVSQRPITNYTTKILCSDNGYNITMALVNADPWGGQAEVWEHSPLRYASRVCTPTLFLQSDQDYCCPMNESLQMYSALQRYGVDTKLCLFHGESHELSRSGRPSNRIFRLNEMIAWFQTHLVPET